MIGLARHDIKAASDVEASDANTVTLLRSATMSQHTVNGAARTVNQFTPLTIKGTAAVITLTQGRHALIDLTDFALVGGPSGLKWTLHETRGTCHAYRNDRRGAKTLLMHQLLLPTPEGLMADHKNRDGLDNRRQNLRPATKTQNQRNQGPTRGGSGFKGVGFDKRKRSWRAQITASYKNYYLGNFKTAEDAARAYDRAAAQHFGEFAYFNFPQEQTHVA